MQFLRKSYNFLKEQSLIYESSQISKRPIKIVRWKNALFAIEANYISAMLAM